ncbi:MAG: Na/Pi cotransporter family protein [Bacteroidales bacterium]|jgi:phosphate:Na+ symporter|nr:Na/Pi cotransporter family protein [Bacteroidales bacterium]
MNRILLIFVSILLLNIYLTTNIYAQTKDSIPIYKLIKPTATNNPNFSGDNQTQKANTQLKYSIKAKLLNSKSKGISDIPIIFRKISSPEDSKNFEITETISYTDTLGIASIEIYLGDKQGEYIISAQQKNDPTGQQLIYTVTARQTNWGFILIMGLLGGLGLFLLGMTMMSDGMQEAAGDKMRTILSHLTHNRFIAVGLGTFVTTITQSSSATTVMLVSFVHSKLMRFRQTLGIILGAGIGATITAQLIASQLTNYSLLLIGIGFFINSFAKKTQLKNIGKTIMGFGILFFGMNIMSDAMSPLRSYSPFVNALIKLENPLIGILAGTLFTALIQSSAAFIGIMIVLGTQNLLSLEASIPLILGANIGTSITAILASIKANKEGKKVALAHSLIKTIGVLLFIWWIPQFSELIQYLSPKGNGISSNLIPRQMANAHTFFNITLTILLLPFLNFFAKVISKLLPGKPITPKVTLQTKYLDFKQTKSSSLALSMAKQETIRMGQLVQNINADIIIPFLIKDTKLFISINKTEKEINFLRDKITSFLLKTIKEKTSDARVNEAFQIMYTVKEFEQIADIISKKMVEKAKTWSESNYEFSKDGKNELINYHTKTQKQLSRAITVFKDVNLEKAKAMKKKYSKYRDMSIELEKHHFERLKKQISDTISSSKTHLDVMNDLRSINSHATNIAGILLKWSELNPEDKT